MHKITGTSILCHILHGSLYSNEEIKGKVIAFRTLAKPYLIGSYRTNSVKSLFVALLNLRNCYKQ